MRDTSTYLCRICGAELSYDEEHDRYVCGSCDFEMARDEYLERFA